MHPNLHLKTSQCDSFPLKVCEKCHGKGWITPYLTKTQKFFLGNYALLTAVSTKMKKYNYKRV